jgi:lysophospholipid acyltransferase (LPLAT)-like uncharacterized protein
MIERFLPLGASLLAKTLRVEWVGEALPTRVVVMFWHENMFAGWYSVRRRKPVALVSRSKDGRFLASVLTAWKYKLARGSSGKKGMEALAEAMEMVKKGEADVLVITPDGPRGPRHVFKRGAFLAATDLVLPLFMLRIRNHSAIALAKSWDRFQIPFPFTRVSIDVERIDLSDFPREDSDAQRAWLDSISLRFTD